MRTSFGTLCTLGVTHAYYGGAISRDFSFVIPDATARLLQQARMIAKVAGGRLHVLFERAAGGGAFIPAAGSVIRIGLKVNTPYFANFTALDFDSRSAIAVYGNAADAGKLGAPVLASLVGSIFAHTLKKTQGAVDVTLTPAGGAQIDAVHVAAAAARPDVSFDLSGRPAGLYTVAEDAGGAIEKTTYFVDPELVAESIFGVVEVAIDEAFYAAAAAFTIAFASREETLRYFIVTRNLPAGDFEKLHVEDAGEPDRAKVAFTDRVADNALTNAEKQLIAVLPGIADAQVAVFRSETPVKRRAQGYGRIELKKNGEAIVENLPQAGVERPTADLIFVLSKPKPKVP